MSHASWISPKSGNYLHSERREEGGGGQGRADELLEIGDDFVRLPPNSPTRTSQFFPSTSRTFAHAHLQIRVRENLSKFYFASESTVGRVCETPNNPSSFLRALSKL